MSIFSDPAGRRLLTGLYGSLIPMAVSIALYLMKAPHYEHFFYLFVAYVIWVYGRFLRERKKPVDYAPWYTSRTKVGLFCALLNVLVGILALVKHSEVYVASFALAAMFLIGAGVFQYRETRTNSRPRRKNNDTRSL